MPISKRIHKNGSVAFQATDLTPHFDTGQIARNFDRHCGFIDHTAGARKPRSTYGVRRHVPVPTHRARFPSPSLLAAWNGRS